MRYTRFWGSLILSVGSCLVSSAALTKQVRVGQMPKQLAKCGCIDEEAEKLRYVLVPKEVANVLKATSKRECKACQEVEMVAAYLNHGIRFCPRADLVPAVDVALQRVGRKARKILKQFREKLAQQEEHQEGITTVPMTIRRLNCETAAACSGALEPDFTQDIAILQGLRDGFCSGADGICASLGGLPFSCSGFLPTGCVPFVSACINFNSGITDFCIGLAGELIVECQELGRIDCERDPFSGVVPVIVPTAPCLPVSVPATAALPQLPDLSGVEPIFICDIEANSIQVDVGLFEELGVIGNLNVSGNGIFGGDLDVNGNIVANGSLDLGSGAVSGGDLDLSGDATIGGDLCVSGSANIVNGLLVGGDIGIAGGLAVDDSIVANGDLTIAGAVNAQSGLFASGPICAGDVIVDRLQADTACIGALGVDALGAATACIAELKAQVAAIDLLCVQGLIAIGSGTTLCSEIDQAIVGTACIRHLDVEHLRAMTACMGTVSMEEFAANTACIGNAVIDRVASDTACIQNADVCQLLLQDLFLDNILQFNGSATGICGFPQGFGELLFVARDFCNPLCPEVAANLVTGCNENASVDWLVYPYTFTGCAQQEVICGVPLRQCTGNVASLAHVDFSVPKDYNGDFEIDLFTILAPNQPQAPGMYETRAQIQVVPLGNCPTGATANQGPFLSVTVDCDVPAFPPVPVPLLTKITLRPDPVQAALLTEGAWIRVALDFSEVPAGFDTQCPPLISSMTFRYARKDLDEAFAIFPG